MVDTIDINLRSGRVVTLRDLNGLEQTNADKAAREIMAIPSYRAAMAVSAIDGENVIPPKTDLELEAILSRFSGRELSQIVNAYGKNYGLTNEDLGNE